MPDRPLTIATYAAGASLAAATLVYVFGPTFFFDNDAAQSSKSSRKKGVVGLNNPANDCFINSVLQSLAGLPQLRLYLIQEMHRRQLDGSDLYHDISAALAIQAKKPPTGRVPEWKLAGLQQGLITAGLKNILDALNERPLNKKTISAQSFIRVVEESFRTRVSRSQQDAHEFLQIVAERLAEEYRAAHLVRKSAEKYPPSDGPQGEDTPEDQKDSDDVVSFPLEGKMESRVECLYCHFKPKPSASSFVVLTLHVPQDSNTTTLNACLDGMLKVEHIDDFTCDKCRLEHALEQINKSLARHNHTTQERAELESHQSKILAAIESDPEKPPKDVPLPNLATVPKRRIARHMRISHLPRILSIHLSRSVWDPYSSSTKNTAKVAFPETLSLGGLLDRQRYRLLSVVTHKGGHNSGHYESFRRQSLNPPFSTPNSMGTEGIYSIRSSPATSARPSAVPSPQLHAMHVVVNEDTAESMANIIPSSSTPSGSSPATAFENFEQINSQTRSSPSRHSSSQPSRIGISTSDAPPPRPNHYLSDAINFRGAAKNRGRAGQDRWWRISDDKIKESKTSDVLGMQKEVYLLFYEMER